MPALVRSSAAPLQPFTVIAGSPPAAGAAAAYGRDAEIYGEGEPAEFVYRVASGAVRTVRYLDDGRRQVIGFHLAGDLFGIEGGLRHAATAEAIADSRVTVTGRAGLLAEAERDGAVARAVIAALAGTLAGAESHMVLLGRMTARERLVTFLEGMAARSGDGTILLPMSRIDIADHLGLTIETVSRTFTQIEHEGVIRLDGARRVLMRHRAQPCRAAA